MKMNGTKRFAASNFLLSLREMKEDKNFETNFNRAISAAISSDGNMKIFFNNPYYIDESVSPTMDPIIWLDLLESKR